MRSLCRAIALGLALGALGATAWADVTYTVYVKNTTSSLGTVQPGGFVDLWVVMVTGGSDTVSGVRYDVLLPTNDWELTSRDYGTYNWYEEDGLWDNSTPKPSNTPATVNNSLYPVTPSDPDFNLNTICDPWPNTVTGQATTEDFRLTIPSSTPVGEYTISLRNPYAYDEYGSVITAAVGEDFGLRVVPEPATMLLTISGLAVLGVRIRRRRK
jgi:hypothetical protein